MSQVPTVGRRMWYKAGYEDFSVDGLIQLSEQPFDAGVVHVNSNGTVNVVVMDHYGTQRFREAVEVYEGEGEPEQQGEGRVYWLPYQKAQHEKQAADGK